MGLGSPACAPGQLKQNKTVIAASEPWVPWGPLRSVGREQPEGLVSKLPRSLFQRPRPCLFHIKHHVQRSREPQVQHGDREAPVLGVPCALLGRTHHPIPGKDAVAWARSCFCSQGSAHGAPAQGSQVHFLIVLATPRTRLPVGLGRTWRGRNTPWPVWDEAHELSAHGTSFPSAPAFVGNAAVAVLLAFSSLQGKSDWTPVW